MASYYSSLFADQVTGGVQAPDFNLKVDPTLQHGRLRSTYGTITPPTVNADGDKFALAIVKPTDRIWQFFCSVEGDPSTNSPDYEVGLCLTNNQREIGNEVGAQNSICDLDASAAVTWADQLAAANVGKTFWEIGGLSAAPSYNQLMIALEVETAATTAAQQIRFRIVYTAGD